MTNKKITFQTSPTFYGDNNVTLAFQKGEIGFELMIEDDTCRHRDILTLENALELKRQIENALSAYDEFMKSYGKQND